MTVWRRSPVYPLCLLVGALLFGSAGLAHPLLTGDGPTQLAVIAGTPAWRTIHWALLFGLPLMFAGLIGLALRHAGTPGDVAARAGALLATLGFGGWMLNVLFMVGAGGQLARAYATADPGLTATQAIFVYDMLHPFGLAAERVATFTVGFALYAYGWGIRNGQVYPRWLGWLGIAIGATAAAVAVVFTEFSLNMFYAQALVVVWFAVVGALMLRDARARVT